MACPADLQYHNTSHTAPGVIIRLRKKGGHNSVSFTKHTNGSSTRSDTYGAVAAEVDEIPSAQDAATYLEEGYTPDTSIVVAEDNRTDQVPSVGTSEVAEVKR